MSNVFNSPFSDLARKKTKDWEDELKKVSDRDLLANGTKTFVSEIVARHRLEIPILSDSLEFEPVPPPRGSRAILATVNIPISGDHILFEFSGQTSIHVAEGIGVYPDHLTIAIPAHFDRPHEVRNKADKILMFIKECLASLDEQVKHYNDELPHAVRTRLIARVAELRAYEQFTAGLQSAGISIIRRNDEAEKVVIPVVRRVLTVSTGQVGSKQSDPFLSMDHYDDIIRALISMMNVVERSPTVFESMEEEDLRTILLVGLNGIFKGQATGETFNGHGKNDILVRVEDKNVFIAECLMWKGPEYLRSKLDSQLFRYATWRDSKLSVIVFNRNKRFSQVLAAMISVLAEHPLKVRMLSSFDNLGGKYLFRRADDANQQFYLTALAFDVPRQEV